MTDLAWILVTVIATSLGWLAALLGAGKRRRLATSYDRYVEAVGRQFDARDQQIRDQAAVIEQLLEERKQYELEQRRRMQWTN